MDIIVLHHYALCVHFLLGYNRLFISPIKVDSLNFDEMPRETCTSSNYSNEKSEECTYSKDENSEVAATFDESCIPDMKNVLAKFGINVDNDLESQHTHTKNTHTERELSISQRIKTLRREARHKPTGEIRETDHFIFPDF